MQALLVGGLGINAVAGPIAGALGAIGAGFLPYLGLAAFPLYRMLAEVFGQNKETDQEGRDKPK